MDQYHNKSCHVLSWFSYFLKSNMMSGTPHFRRRLDAFLDRANWDDVQEGRERGAITAPALRYRFLKSESWASCLWWDQCRVQGACNQANASDIEDKTNCHYTKPKVTHWQLFSLIILSDQDMFKANSHSNAKLWSPWASGCWSLRSKIYKISIVFGFHSHEMQNEL